MPLAHWDGRPEPRMVAEAGRRRRVDAVEELPRLGRFQHRRLAALHDVLRTAHRRGRSARVFHLRGLIAALALR
jgi:hypothetical protein